MATYKETKPDIDFPAIYRYLKKNKKVRAALKNVKKDLEEHSDRLFAFDKAVRESQGNTKENRALLKRARREGRLEPIINAPALYRRYKYHRELNKT